MKPSENAYLARTEVERLIRVREDAAIKLAVATRNKQDRGPLKRAYSVAMTRLDLALDDYELALEKRGAALTFKAHLEGTHGS